MSKSTMANNLPRRAEQNLHIVGTLGCDKSYDFAICYLQKSRSIVLAIDGKLVAIVVADTDIRRRVLRTINPELPLYSQLYDVEITDVPLQKTEKQTIKRYLYK